jgi:hypothetical protein
MGREGREREGKGEKGKGGEREVMGWGKEKKGCYPGKKEIKKREN